MTLWAKNKLFVIFGGVIFVVYVYLWPSILGRWLAPWEGPVVARPDRGVFEDAQRKVRQNEDQFEEYYHSKGVPVINAIREADEGNKVLLDNFQGMHRWMSFIPRYPFRIPGGRTEKNRRQRYVTQAYTYLRDGELICDEYGRVYEPHSGIVFATATRNIELDDPYFGMRDMELPDAIGDPDLAILQVALIHEIGQLAIRCGVDEITSIAPQEPYVWKVRGKGVARAFPLNATFKCDLATLMKLLHALDGAHGRVAELGATEEAPAKAAPKAAVKKAIPAAALPDDEPDDEDPEDAPAARGATGPPAARLVIRFYGEPSIFAPDPERAGLQERVTIFRPAEDESHKLLFVANAIITRDLGTRLIKTEGDLAPPGGAKMPAARRVRMVEAEVEPSSTLRFAPDGSQSRLTVRRGDYAATRFLLVRSMKVRSDEGEIKLDKDGFPAEVTPRHLVVDLSVAALQFLEIKMPKIARVRRRVKSRPLHRGW